MSPLHVIKDQPIGLCTRDDTEDPLLLLEFSVLNANLNFLSSHALIFKNRCGNVQERHNNAWELNFLSALRITIEEVAHKSGTFLP